VRRAWGPDDVLIREILRAARAVHAALGPGFVESTYENAVAVQLRAQAVPYERQVPVPVRYREIVVGVHRVDLLVDRRLIVEMKAVKDLLRVHFAVVRSYLRATGSSAGLLLNFGRESLDVRHVVPVTTEAPRPRAWAGPRPFSHRTRRL
jgi:GxxExxY protein